MVWEQVVNLRRGRHVMYFITFEHFKQNLKIRQCEKNLMQANGGILFMQLKQESQPKFYEEERKEVR
jgi:hypothetical protein